MKNIFKAVSFLILIGALLGGLWLVRKNQETRRGATIAETSSSILPTTVTTDVGKTFVVNLWVNTGSTGDSLQAAEMEVKYDGAKIEYQGVEALSEYSLINDPVVVAGEGTQKKLPLKMAAIGAEKNSAIHLAKLTFKLVADNSQIKAEGKLLINGKTEMWDIATNNVGEVKVNGGTTCENLSDDFSGAALETTKWTPLVGDYRTVTQSSGKVNLSIGGSAPADQRGVGIKSVKTYSEDFEASVDVDAVSVQNGQWATAEILVRGSGNYFTVRLVKDENNAYASTYFKSSGGTELSSQAFGLTSTSGKLYLAKKGDELSGYIEVNGGKHFLGSNIVTLSEPVAVEVISWRSAATSGAQATIDNFKLTCGTPSQATCTTDADCPTNFVCSAVPPWGCPKKIVNGVEEATTCAAPPRCWRKAAKIGEMCGGIVGIMCEAGLRCDYGGGIDDGRMHPMIADQSGTCVRDCISKPACVDGIRNSNGEIFRCELQPQIASNYCPDKPCGSDADCQKNEFCSHPPIDCPAGANCMQPAPVCRAKRALAQEGQMCGGIQGIMCAAGLTCDYGANVGKPDASGTCVVKTTKCSWVDSANPDPGYTLVENDNSAITYSGENWPVYCDANAHGGSLTWNNKGYAELNFTGTAVKVYGRKAPAAGIDKFYIDDMTTGNFVGRFDAYSPTVESQVLMFEKTGLTPGNHKLRVLATENKNPSSQGTNLHIDFVTYGSPTVTVTPTEIPTNESLKFKTTFAGVGVGATCAGYWTGDVTVLWGNNQKKLFSGVALNKTTESVNGLMVFTGEISMKDVGGKNKLAIFVKGPRSLQTKYGKDAQGEFYNKPGGEIDWIAGKVFDFTKYPNLAGDVTGPDGNRDGVVDGIDFAYVKGEVSKRSEGDGMKADLNGNCKLESVDLTLLMLAIKDKQEQMY